MSRIASSGAAETLAISGSTSSAGICEAGVPELRSFMNSDSRFFIITLPLGTTRTARWVRLSTSVRPNLP